MFDLDLAPVCYRCRVDAIGWPQREREGLSAGCKRQPIRQSKEWQLEEKVLGNGVAPVGNLESKWKTGGSHQSPDWCGYSLLHNTTNHPFIIDLATEKHFKYLI